MITGHLLKTIFRRQLAPPAPPAAPAPTVTPPIAPIIHTVFQPIFSATTLYITTPNPFHVGPFFDLPDDPPQITVVEEPSLEEERLLRVIRENEITADDLQQIVSIRRLQL